MIIAILSVKLNWAGSFPFSIKVKCLFASVINPQLRQRCLVLTRPVSCKKVLGHCIQFFLSLFRFLFFFFFPLHVDNFPLSMKKKWACLRIFKKGVSWSLHCHRPDSFFPLALLFLLFCQLLLYTVNNPCFSGIQWKVEDVMQNVTLGKCFRCLHDILSFLKGLC